MSILLLLTLLAGLRPSASAVTGPVPTPVRAMACNVGSESISPCTPAKIVQPNAAFAQAFTIQNNYIEADNFAITVTPGAAAQSCSATPSNLTVNSHSQNTFTINCTAKGDALTGTVNITAAGGLQTVTATISVTVNAIDVLPDTAIKVKPDTTYTQAFKIKNLGGSGTPSAVTDSVTCSGVTLCTVLEGNAITVAHGDSSTVHVTYHSGAVASSGSVRLRAYLTSTASKDSALVSLAVPTPLAPTVSATPHNADNRAVGLCVAACFDLTMSYSTPPYYSMSVARSATLVYTSAQARPMPIVQVDVLDSSTFKADDFDLKLKDGGAFVTFRNGAQDLYYRQSVGGQTNRLAGQFDGTALPTGVRFDSVSVVSNWVVGAYHGTTTTTSLLITLLVLNEQASPFGAGWSLAGLQRLYFTTDSLTIAVTDGAGSITRFSRGTKTSPATAVADFTTLSTILSSGTVVGFERRARDGSVAGFNTAGYLTYVTDRFADTTKFAYDGSNRITTITDPAGKVLSFAYTLGKLSTITDPGGRVTTFSINGSGDLVSITDVTNTVSFQALYDSHHLDTLRTDRAGNTWKYVYDFASKLKADSTPSVKVDLTLSGTGTLTMQRLGARQRALESGILPDTATTQGSLANPVPQRLSSTVRAAIFAVNGDSTTYKLDRFLAPQQVEQLTTQDTTVFTRDASERVTALVHRIKKKVIQSAAASFDGPRLASAFDLLAKSGVSYTYDTTYDIPTKIMGTMPTVRNYLNPITKKWIDSTRVGSNPDTTKDSVTAFRRDNRGRDTLVLDPKRDSTFTYYAATGFQNVDSVRSGTRTVRFRYESSYGRLIRTVNPQRDSVILILDALNRVDTTIAPNGTRTAVAFDAAGNVTSVTDAKGQVYRYYYNPLGWTDSLADATTLHAKDRYEYTRLGAVRAHIDRNGKPTTRTFDRLGRDSVVTLADGRKTKYAYSDSALWVADSSAESVDTIFTDTTKHTSTQKSCRGATCYLVKLKSDTLGLLRSRVFTMGTDTTPLQKITYGYDVNFRLDTLGVDGRLTLFGYNGDGMLTYRRLTTKNAQGARVTLDSAAYATTAVHQRYSVTHSAASLDTLNEYYTRDSLERITQRTAWNQDTAWTYTYDKMGQLTNYATLYYSGGDNCTPDPRAMDGQHCVGVNPVTLQSTAYTYDSVGNRTDGSPTIIAGNRLTAWQGTTLTYDSVGNLRHKTKTGFDQWLYWNSLGQLDSVKTTIDTTTTRVGFGYDGFGRRVRKTVGAAVYKFVYDGDQVLTVDSAGTRIRTYSYYPGIDQPHSMIRANGTGMRYYYLSESGAGSVWGIVDTLGAVKDRYRYAPYGSLADSVDTLPNPYRFTGREYDSETQLYYYRARYYDASLARFVSEDPIGLAGGSNQYAYASNDPVGNVDPSGTSVFNYVPGGCSFRMVFATDSHPCGGGAGGSAGGSGGYGAPHFEPTATLGALLNQALAMSRCLTEVHCNQQFVLGPLLSGGEPQGFDGQDYWCATHPKVKQCDVSKPHPPSGPPVTFREIGFTAAWGPWGHTWQLGYACEYRTVHCGWFTSDGHQSGGELGLFFGGGVSSDAETFRGNSDVRCGGLLIGGCRGDNEYGTTGSIGYVLGTPFSGTWGTTATSWP